MREAFAHTRPGLIRADGLSAPWPRPLSHRQAAGGMFWLSWNKLVGSYSFFSSTNRR